MLLWREKNIRLKSFILILSFIVGIAGGVAALLLKTMIHAIQGVLGEYLNHSEANYLFLIYPVVGIFLSGLFVRYVVKDNISHGITRILYAISQKKSRLKVHNTYSSMVASSITIGFGGSVGAEAPIVYTGAAIGSNIGRFFKVDQRVLMLLIGCGAAAGIAGIFKAPIAGLLFTLEVLMLDLTAMSVMPLLIASTTAATVAYIFTGSAPQFDFMLTEAFLAPRIPYVVMLGIFCGFVSLYFTRTMNWLEDSFGHLKNPWYKFGVGALLLCVSIFFLPSLYGEGYEAILDLLNNQPENLTEGSFFYSARSNFWVVFSYIALVILVKVFATSATNAGGGVGGTFAPSLFVGCMSGFIFAYLLNHLGVPIELSQKNFALMGMAGMMAGVMHAPLMAIFLTAEMTGGYGLFLPLMITSTVAYGTIKIFEPHSIYTMRLARKGELLTHHKDKTVLTLLKIDSVIETDFSVVNPEMSLGDMVKVISNSHRNIYPVVNDHGKMLGIVLLDDIRNIMFRPDLYSRMYVGKFMISPPAKIEIGEPMDQVMKTFDQTNAWNLPVVENGKYVGFVSKSKIFNSYRRVLVHYSED